MWPVIHPILPSDVLVPCLSDEACSTTLQTSADPIVVRAAGRRKVPRFRTITTLTSCPSESTSENGGASPELVLCRVWARRLRPPY